MSDPGDDIATPEVERLAIGLREHTAAFAAAVEGIDPAAVVPTCPRWRVRDLVGHVGHAHRWAAELVRTRAASPVPDPPAAGPGDPARWTGWLRDGAAGLLDAIADTGAETSVWTFLGPRPAAFWLRRMLHDTAVHHADAAITAGRPFVIAADLAADAISEGLDLLSAPEAAALNPASAGLRGCGQTLQLRPTVGAGWLITRAATGVTWERRSVDADVVVAGAVADLLLLFSRRAPVDDAAVTVTGDRALLDDWLARTAF